MEKVNVPLEKAIEPNEEARQPLVSEESVTPKLTGQPTRKMITFAEDADNETPSQKNSSYKNVLSQPTAEMSHRQRLQWLQKRRTSGLWAQCDECLRWRFLPQVLDSYELPNKWLCSMNPDPTYADCSIPDAPITVRDEEDLIHSEYSAGSVVWARMAGWPWWPAMVDDCPDTEQFYWLDGFSDIPTHYNVVFFDSKEVTRGWVAPQNLKPYNAYKKTFQPFLKDKKFKTRLQAAVKQADDASKLPIVERLEKYSFLARYQGAINSPRVNMKDLKKQQKRLKRKFRIQFEESESEDEVVVQPKSPAHGVKIILGKRKTPEKRVNREASRFISHTEKTVDEDQTDASTEKINKAQTVDKIVEPKTPALTGTQVKSQSETNVESNIQPAKNTEADSTTEIFKQPTSLAVLVGSATESQNVDVSFDNDTSKTYVPEKETCESTENDTLTPTPTREFQVVIESQNSDIDNKSDDFEYD